MSAARHRPEFACAHAPASVANCAVGFDLLGHSIAGPGDRAVVRRSREPAVTITAVRGCVSTLPRAARLNTAGRALESLRAGLGLDYGFDCELEKGIPLGSGIGGSAASCVAALVAANELLDQPLPREALYRHALDGESVASGGRHGDNVGATLLGGLVLATETRIVRLDVPSSWHAAVVHPDQCLETRIARAAVAGTYRLAEFVEQSAQLALVLTACARGDAALMRGALVDTLVEPRRAPLVPGFGAVQRAALAAGAFGASLSGAGPSVFAWFESRAEAEAAVGPMRAAFAAIDVATQAWVSPIAGPAAEVIR